MADNTEAIRVYGVDGAKCYVAPLGSTLPTGLDPFGAQWWDLGAFNPEGLTETYEEERSEKRPLGYKSPVRTDIISITKTITTPVWETNPYTMALYDNVPLSALEELEGGVIHYPAYRPEGQRKYMMALDVFDGTNHERTVFPIAEVTTRGEKTRNAETVSQQSLTWTIYEGSDGLMFDKYYLSDGMWLPVETLEISGTAEVVVASTTQLTATANYFDGETGTDVSSDAEWDTSDAAVATVDDVGEVTGVSAGSATISAMYRGAGGNVEVTVTEA